MSNNQNNERHYTIYCHRNKINNKAYIGQTGEIPYTRRWQGHGASGTPYAKCRHFQNAIIKYGWDNFEHFILKDNLTAKEANYYEYIFIHLFNTLDPNIGYNLREGGNNHAHSDETKKLISEARKGQFLSEETKQKISEKMSGSNNPRAKKVLCIETNQIFNTAKEAGEWVKRDYSAICKVCNGKAKTCGGYHWKYIE